MLLFAFPVTDFQISYSYTDAYSCLYKHNKSQTLCKQGLCLDMDYHGIVLVSFFFFYFFICPLRCLFSKGWLGCIYPLCPFWSLSPGSEGLCGHTSVSVVGKGRHLRRKLPVLNLSEILIPPDEARVSIAYSLISSRYPDLGSPGDGVWHHLSLAGWNTFPCAPGD